MRICRLGDLILLNKAKRDTELKSVFSPENTGFLIIKNKVSEKRRTCVGVPGSVSTTMAKNRGVVIDGKRLFKYVSDEKRF